MLREVSVLLSVALPWDSQHFWKADGTMDRQRLGMKCRACGSGVVSKTQQTENAYRTNVFVYTVAVGDQGGVRQRLGAIMESCFSLGPEAHVRSTTKHAV